MRRSRAIPLLLIAGLSIALLGCSSSDKESTEKTTTTAAGGGVSAGGGGTPVEVVVSDTKGEDGPMTMTVAPPSVPAGKVTFTLKNTGTVKHEMVVLKTDTPYDQLTVDKDNKVSEDTSVGEVSELDAGKTGTVTLDLKPGKYVLVCNIAKHYEMGMRAPFTVT